MARRKSALAFLLLFLLILILSPWASAPSPSVSGPPEQNKSTPQAVQPVMELEPVHLRVAVSMAPEEFDLLLKQNEEQSVRFPDITAELERTDPDKAFTAFRTASRMGLAADVMLVENEWVKSFAASGFLMPADSAFVGEALSEQFDALLAPLKWNGYEWGVPRDFDPYVIVWNLPALHTLLGESAAPPLDLTQWTELAAKSREGGTAIPWLAVNRRDPLALLAWVQSVSGQRTDSIWSEGDSAWSGTPRGAAIVLMDRERTGVAFKDQLQDIAASVTTGKAAAALLPYSEAEKLTGEGFDAGAAALTMDRSAWQTAYTWPRGRSFAVSSHTGAEDAARRWIAAMTETFIQQDISRTTRKLPVYRSLFRNGSRLFPLFKGHLSTEFPFLPPTDFGPELPVRLERLGSLWGAFASGNAGSEEWIRLWPDTSADFELNH